MHSSLENYILITIIYSSPSDVHRSMCAHTYVLTHLHSNHFIKWIFAITWKFYWNTWIVCVPRKYSTDSYRSVAEASIPLTIKCTHWRKNVVVSHLKFCTFIVIRYVQGSTCVLQQYPKTLTQLDQSHLKHSIWAN